MHSPDKLRSISGMLVYTLNLKMMCYTCVFLMPCCIKDVCRRVEGCDPPSSDAEVALSVLSIVGVTLSLFGLAVTIFTMVFFK